MPKKIVTLQDWIDSTLELQDLPDEDLEQELDHYIMEQHWLDQNPHDTSNPWPWPTQQP